MSPANKESNMQSKTLVRFDNVRKVYQMGTAEVRALDGVSLSFGRGSFWAIMGPSGSGKVRC